MDRTTLNIDRLTAVLSDILSDRFGKEIKVTMEGKNDNSNSVSCDSVPGKRAWFPDVRNVV